jgi:putative flippase GtrA
VNIKIKLKMIFDKVFLKFLLVGVINTIVGSTIMFGMHNVMHMSYWLSSGFGYYISAAFGFLLNKRFTFTVKRWSVFMVVSFIVVIVVSYYLPYWFAEYAVNTFIENNEGNIYLRGNIALVAGTCMASAVSYLGQRFIVFRKKEKEEEEINHETHETTRKKEI